MGREYDVEHIYKNPSTRLTRKTNNRSEDIFSHILIIVTAESSFNKTSNYIRENHKVQRWY